MPSADPGAVAGVRGINVYGKPRVDGRDRRQLERLCRYLLRPPLSQERLVPRADGTLELTLKASWKDGTRRVLLTPDELVARLVAAIAPPRFHMLRYFGVLAAHAKERGEVVAQKPPAEDRYVAPPAPSDQLVLPCTTAGHGPDENSRRQGRKRWAWLLRHVFARDIDTCLHCRGPMRWQQVVDDPRTIAKLLQRHGLRAHATRRRPSRTYLPSSGNCDFRSAADDPRSLGVPR